MSAHFGTHSVPGPVELQTQIIRNRGRVAVRFETFLSGSRANDGKPELILSC